MPEGGLVRFGVGRARDAWQVAFDRPIARREARTPDGVVPLVDWAEAQARAGHWVAVVLAYEAAPSFDAALVTQPAPDGLPFAWAAAYGEADRVLVDSLASVPGVTAPPIDWRAAIDQLRFTQDVEAILARIAAGDTYQVNYTFPLTTVFEADPLAWWQACAAAADVPYAAYLDLGSHVVMSLSPELFIARQADVLRARPMKGTARRGRWRDEDRALAAELGASAKARAENVMIVDLLRNDIGRVARTGTVRVADLCRLERYPTVWQLTSSIEARVAEGVDLVGILRAVFPCGSVTGAPKVRTMAIIAGLESAARGVYTGAIGLLEPGGDATFSVPIRTAVLDRASGVATFHVGAGIVADSVPSEEWQECLAKARVVRPPAVTDDVALLETLRLEGGVLIRREEHVARVVASADLFGWVVPVAAIEAACDSVAVQHPAGLWRVRLRVERTGVVEASAVPFEPDARPWHVRLATEPVDARSPLLFNKTTDRRLYERARAACPEADDVLLWNGRGELTESTVANVVVEFDGQRVTPPVSCGLLPGVLRGVLVARGEVQERVVRLADLPQVTRMWLVNSLRGWIDVTFDA